MAFEVAHQKSILDLSMLNGPVEASAEDDNCEQLFVPAPRSWYSERTDNEDSREESYLVNERSAIHHIEDDENCSDGRLPGDDDDAASTVSREESDSCHSVFSLAGTNAAKAIARPLPSPSWAEISCQVLPAAAHELMSATLHRFYYAANLGFAASHWQRQYSDLGIHSSGYFAAFDNLTLPPFSSLSWVERQLVKEWRTYEPRGDEGDDGDDADEEESEFRRARALIPRPAPRPIWRKADACTTCQKTFGPSRLRHHCRLCGRSFCQSHSARCHPLPHLGYHPDVPERVCDDCHRMLLDRNLAERVTWRLARCRDHAEGNLTPYFETGVDTFEKIALRVTQAALAMARSIPLGAQATVAVETVDVLRKYGLNGIYTIMLRQEFLAAADMLRKALGINRTAWPLSVHELSAAIFYALAQHRAMRGLNPEGEHALHTFRIGDTSQVRHEEYPGRLYSNQIARISELVSERNDREQREAQSNPMYSGRDPPNAQPVCDPVPDEDLESIVFYAPMALSFVYAEKEVDMQLLAAQQGWRLLYTQLENPGISIAHDLPASALFIRDDLKVVCLAVRGTTTIHDVITDIRQVPLPFPENHTEDTHASRGNSQVDGEWTEIHGGQGVAVCGMANAATNLYQEHIDAIMYFARKGYDIRLTGHSLGGGVAALLGALIWRDVLREGITGKGNAENVVKVYSYGSPPCVDERLCDLLEPFVVSIVLHDDVVPRLTPTSCRELLKHLLYIRETWVKEHLPDDIMAITDRAKTAWAPRWRGSFTLPTSSTSIRRMCRQHIQYGKRSLKTVRRKLVGGDPISYHPWKRASGEDSMNPMTLMDNPQQATNNSATDRKNTPEGVIIDGDRFFDAGSSCQESDYFRSSSFHEAYQHEEQLQRRLMYGSQAVGSNIEDLDKGGTHTNDFDLSRGAVVLDETPLPQMYLPGRVLHVYAHRGVFKAAYVPRDFPEIRRISLAANMLSDHKSKAYYEALLELKSVRRASEAPPRWTAFDEDDTW